MRLRAILFFSLISLFANRAVYSQIYNFNLYTEDNGLAQNYIYSISQNKDGFLYLATGNGFVAYGGNKFNTFTTSDSLSENFVNIHFTDSRDITWLGHFQMGVSYIKNNQFFKIKNSDSLESKIVSFAEDKNKNIWFAVQGKGVFFIDTAFNFQGPFISDEKGINCLTIDQEGSLICGSEYGLLFYNVQNPTKPLLKYSLAELDNKSIKCLVWDFKSPKLFWVSVPGEGVFGIKKGTKGYNLISQITTELKSTSKNVLTLYSDHDACLWISLANEGLKKVTFENLKFRNKFSILTINSDNGLASNYIKSIFEDFERNMWFGSFGQGLIEMPRARYDFYKPKLDNDIKSIFVEKAGELWLGTTSGLLRYNTNDSTRTKLYSIANGFIKDKVNAVFRDNAGTLWIGTDISGLYTHDTLTEKFENFSKKNKLTNFSINCITQSKDSTLYIGTKDGVYVIRPKTEKIDLLTTMEGLLHNNVVQIYSDSKGRVWFCSKGTPPYFLKGDEITVIKDIPGMLNFSITGIVEDKNGLVWIATGGDGVFSFDGKKTKNFRVENNLLSNFCYSLLCNSKNEIVLTHKNGLTSIQYRGELITNYKRADGLLFAKNNMNSSAADTKGGLWFGTEEGLVLYSQIHNVVYMPEPKTTILQIKLNDKQFKKGELIDLSYSSFNVHIDFIGISLTDPTKVLYKYRLLGLDTTWRYTTERFIEFPKIVDGDYDFQVLASSAEGIWNAAPASIYFKIEAPFWKTLWFWVSIVISVVVITYLIIRNRLSSLQKTKLILKRNVAEKTMQLKEEKVQLEKVKEILEEKDKDITDSINYAKHIQDALLPSQDIMRKYFPESFILFKPRNIVSGDFYWFGETKDAYIVAVLDCTGHGIPGAFMSLIGSTLINEIVNNKITIPSKILHALNLGVIRTLRQDAFGSSSRDGMDMSICSINKKKTKMTFSSAARPMFYVRNGELLEINLRSSSIGGHYEQTEKEFTDMEIDLLPNDQFYLFTDGYPDQFNEANNKKFSSKKLKQLCIDISTMGSIEQHNHADRVLQDWKGSTGQIDDITLIGFKI